MMASYAWGRSGGTIFARTEQAHHKIDLRGFAPRLRCACYRELSQPHESFRKEHRVHCYSVNVPCVDCSYTRRLRQMYGPVGTVRLLLRGLIPPLSTIKHFLLDRLSSYNNYFNVRSLISLDNGTPWQGLDMMLSIWTFLFETGRLGVAHSRDTRGALSAFDIPANQHLAPVHQFYSSRSCCNCGSSVLPTR